MILLEATVVNVALPTIGRDLGAGVAGLQWTLNGYVLTLAALVLVGGSLSDIYGRRRIFILGVVVFVAAAWTGTPPTSSPRISRAPPGSGRVDYGAEDHEEMMLALGLQSKREIARIRIRVRTAMATQTRDHGRYLGGRPPYGYRLA